MASLASVGVTAYSETFVMPSKHTLTVFWYGYSGLQYKLECSDPAECDEVFTEGNWDSPNECRCKSLICDCRTGEHAGCEEYGEYIDNVGDACLCVPVDGCGYQDWFSNAGAEMIEDMNPPLKLFSNVVGFEWTGDGPILKIGEDWIAPESNVVWPKPNLDAKFVLDENWKSKPVHGDDRGADIEVEVFEADGEKDYYVRCLCPSCDQIENIGTDAYDPGGKELEVGAVYYMKAWHEKIVIPMVGTEYDGGIAIHENKEDQ